MVGNRGLRNRAAMRPGTRVHSCVSIRSGPGRAERGGRCWLAAGMTAGALTVWAAAGVAAQAQEIQFILSVTDAQGVPVTDLARDEIVISENGIEEQTVRVQPYHVPVKLTLAVDNGPRSREALSHYRSGLAGLVEALPPEVEVTLITIAPQPMMVVRPTTDRQQILRGVNGFAPQEDSPRFTDALVEFSQRLEKEFQASKRHDFLPVLVMVSTTASDAIGYQAPEISRALVFLQQRKARVYITMTSRGGGINDNRQAIIGLPTTELTRGRYEALAAPSRLATLLPEFGREIAALHRKHDNQVLVTVKRQEGLTGPLQHPRIEVTRPDLTGQVSFDGLP